MIKNLINKPIDRHLPNIQSAFSYISKADSVAKKVIKVAELIILFPLLVIKDSVYHLKRCFVKKSSNLKTSQNLIAKHSSAILKAALVGSACLGLIKLRELTGVEVNNQSFLDKLVWPGSVMAALGVGAFISTQHSKEPVNEPELDDPFKDVTSKKELLNKYDELEGALETELLTYESLNCLTRLLKKDRFNSIKHKTGLLNIRCFAKEFQLAKGEVVGEAQNSGNLNDMTISKDELSGIISKLEGVRNDAENFNISEKLKPRLLSLIADFINEITALKEHLNNCYK